MKLAFEIIALVGAGIATILIVMAVAVLIKISRDPGSWNQ